MEDKTIKKLNIPAADLPEVKRTVDGKIDLEAITIETDEKNNKIIPLGNGWEFDLEKKVKRSVLC